MFQSSIVNKDNTIKSDNVYMINFIASLKAAFTVKAALRMGLKPK